MTYSKHGHPKFRTPSSQIKRPDKSLVVALGVDRGRLRSLVAHQAECAVRAIGRLAVAKTYDERRPNDGEEPLMHPPARVEKIVDIEFLRGRALAEYRIRREGVGTPIGHSERQFAECAVR